ncbi:MAG: L-fucose:H+ symporter permease [Syntrophaceae bacterium]|nr:L-fucose:H+ symporter permease [Syntrophaceae bacterium]
MKSAIPLLSESGSRKNLLPFILVTSLFFLWGFAHSILDVLNKHFQEILHLSRAESGMVQFSVYFGYFLAAMPAGYFMTRFGYKRGIIAGLLLYAGGAFLFYPAAFFQSFWPFLAALLVIAFGLAFLETAANPYISVMGPAGSAERRLNLSQSFNGLGWIFGPLIGGLIIFGMKSDDGNPFTTLTWPYIGIGALVLLVALMFIRIPLPEIAEEQPAGEASGSRFVSLWNARHYLLAVVAQFFYVAAQTGINSFFINYVTETIPGISNTTAAIILSFGGMGLFWAGRVSGSMLMRRIAPQKLLSCYALLAVLMMGVVVIGLGWLSVITLFITYFLMSVMFPTIFALGIKGLGPLTKKASSGLIMAIVGGAFCPVFMGYIADQTAMQWGFIVPLVCFLVVFYFATRGYRIQMD